MTVTTTDIYIFQTFKSTREGHSINPPHFSDLLSNFHLFHNHPELDTLFTRESWRTSGLHDTINFIAVRHTWLVKVRITI